MHVVLVTHNSTQPLLIQPLHEEVEVPSRAHDGDAGFDLHADRTIELAPGASALIPTGVAIALPPGTVGMVCPRSGLAAKHQVTVLNAPGIVDAGYRGEVGVILINHGSAPYEVIRGQRIAQLVITPFVAPPLSIVTTLDNTPRGDGGFGSTGR